MNLEQAQKLVVFQNPCTCGGFAHKFNGRDPRRPHMTWCAQYTEYNKWYDLLHSELKEDSPC